MSRLFCLLLLVVGCGSTPVVLSKNCDVRLSAVAPDTAVPGQTVTATGGPMTEIWDSAVYVDSMRAELVAVERLGCEECDSCKTQNKCRDCDECEECDAICDQDCVESIQFVTPEVTGTVQVSLYNGHGQSNGLPLEVLGSADTGNDSGRSGDTDSGTPVDTGATSATDTADDPSTDTDD